MSDNAVVSSDWFNDTFRKSNHNTCCRKLYPILFLHNMSAYYFSYGCVVNIEYSPSREGIQKSLITHGPLHLAGNLEDLGILNPASYFIMNTLNKAPLFYQSSVLLDLILKDLANIDKRKTFMKFIRKNVFFFPFKDFQKHCEINFKSVFIANNYV